MMWLFSPSPMRLATISSSSYLSGSGSGKDYPSGSPQAVAATARRVPYRDRPALRRTRSWRGIMQVRFNDSRADRNRILRHAAFWAPIRLFGLGILVTGVVYFVMGHDFFLHTLLGYESEMQYEARVNPSINNVYGTLLDRDRSWRSSLRQLEQPLHPRREFDVLRDPAEKSSS